MKQMFFHCLWNQKLLESKAGRQCGNNPRGIMSLAV